MQRRTIIKHPRTHGCVLLREGGNHTIYHNPITGTTAPIPRHREISERLVKRICAELRIPEVGKEK
jgi:mRNA interferase HicA